MSHEISDEARKPRDVHEELRSAALFVLDHPCFTNFLCELERAYAAGLQAGREEQKEEERNGL